MPHGHWNTTTLVAGLRLEGLTVPMVTATDATGAFMLFPPPYSSDFNPIEQAFANIKAILRKAAARTVEALEEAIATALDAFSPDECANYFIKFEYEPE